MEIPVSLVAAADLNTVSDQEAVLTDMEQKTALGRAPLFPLPEG